MWIELATYEPQGFAKLRMINLNHVMHVGQDEPSARAVITFTDGSSMICGHSYRELVTEIEGRCE